MNEHVSYEYQMMTVVGKLWGSTQEVPSDVWNNMCNIVAFNAASNLIFYMSKQGLVKLPKDIRSILNKVFDQITCLSKNRTDNADEKLQPADFYKLQAFIEKYKHRLHTQG